MTYEYKVIPAPDKGEKAKGVRTPEGRYAHGFETLLNRMAAEGWDYQRSETLPVAERAGLTAHQTVWHNILVFRRPLTAPEAATEEAAEALAAIAAEPQAAPPVTAPEPEITPASLRPEDDDRPDAPDAPTRPGDDPTRT